MAQESCNLDKEEAEILKPSSPPSSSPTPQSSASSASPLFMNPVHEFSAKKPEKLAEPIEKPKPAARFASRCSSCKRKVGLMGFRCRCGDLFCGQHRYSDTHDCSFDYKALGREQISKANPLIRAAKIIKI